MDDSAYLLDVAGTGSDDRKTLNFYKIIKQFSTACDQKSVKVIKREAAHYQLFKNDDLLQALDENPFNSRKSRCEFRNRLMNSLLRHFYNICQDGTHDMLFLAVAIFDTSKIQELLSRDVNVNQLKFTDSCLIFALKYGDPRNLRLPECVRVLIEAGLDVNHHDFKGKTAMDYLTLLHDYHKDNPEAQQTLTETAGLLLQKGICRVDYEKTRKFIEDTLDHDLSEYKFVELDDKSKVFYWILKNKVSELNTFEHLEAFIDATDSENTLLQLASKKSDSLLPVVQHLLKKGADPNKTTQHNSRSPLELAAFANNQKVFEEILKHKKTKITDKIFKNLVQERINKVRSKVFEIFLESDKLDATFRYEATGNTPLHYAIRFNHKRAIQNLLKRNASLDAKNRLGKCALDVINVGDLETYLDSCLALDNYAEYFTDLMYKMRLRFRCLTDKAGGESRILCKIGNRSSLHHLLGHPLVHAFISLKWHKVRWFFWWILLVQTLLFGSLSVLFCCYRGITESLAFAVGWVNIILKYSIFLRWWWRSGKHKAWSLTQMPLHVYLEVLLTLTLVWTWFQSDFRAFALVEMSICFLLTAGYHPQLSKWSLMLQKVFKTFTVLLLFFSLIILAFAMGFHILFFQDSRAYFENFYSSVFITYVMATGNLNVDKIELDPPLFCRYFFFLLFAMGMCLVIINFWTGVAVSNIDSIEKHSEIDSFRNVIIFLSFVENYLYSMRLVQKICFGLTPMIFSSGTNKEVDFFINRKDQFEGQTGFPKQIDIVCFKKITLYYERTKKKDEEHSVLARLDHIEKGLNSQVEKILKELKSTTSAEGKSTKSKK